MEVMPKEEEFLEQPKKLMKEYVQHGLFLLLDVVFMLFWVAMQALYHVVSEWIIEQAGFGLVDRAVKLCFDIAFGAITFFWVVRTVWRVHRDAYAHRKKRAQQNSEMQKQP